MSTKSLMLEGEADNRADTTESMQREIRRLEGELRDARLETTRAQNEAQKSTTAIRALRDQLSGLYRGLRAVFGEIELAVGEETPQAAPATSGNAHGDHRLHSLDKWDNVKKRLGGYEAELIDVLVTSGPKTNTQLKALLKLGYTSVCNLTRKLCNMGFIVKHGDGYKLKD